MPHIHTDKGQHDLTASSFIFHVEWKDNGEIDTLRLLLHMHKKFNRLLQPGGHVELNETPWDAIKHEMLEETGYEIGQMSILQPAYLAPIQLTNADSIIHPYPLALNTHKVTDEHNHTDISFLFLTEELPKQLPGEGESQDLRWVTQEELNALASNEVTSGVRDIGNRAFHYIQNDEWVGYSPSDFS